MSASLDQVREALQAVFDPCSVNMGAPISIADMGMVSRLDVNADGVVVIELRPTSPMCTLIGSIMRGVEEKLAVVAGVSGVAVTINIQSPWSEADMTSQGRRRLEARRSRSRLEVPVEPRQWKRLAPRSEPT